MTDQPDFAAEATLADLAACLHGHTAATRLPALADLPDCDTIILLLIDGMGEQQLATLCPDGWLARHRQQTLQTVFPSTTTAAITTLMTGQPPATHGLLSWHLWCPDRGCIATPLPLRQHWPERGAPDDAALGEALFATPSAFAANRPDGRRCTVLQPAHIAHSAYSRFHGGQAALQPWRGYDELFDQLHRLARQPGRQLIYAYIPDLDSLMHGKGTTHPRAAHLLHRLDQHCRTLATSLPAGCRLLITADHGQLDIPPARMLYLNDYPALAALLDCPLWGEPRVAFCRTLAGRQHDFQTAVTATLGHMLDCLPARQVLDAGWFGHGPAHPQLATRCGDFVLLMKENWGLLQTVGNELRPTLLGNHGGRSAAEMRIPLISWPPHMPTQD